MLRVVLALLVVGLYVYVLIDLATAKGDDVRGLPRLVWLLVILVIPVVGAITWLVFGRPRPVADGPGLGARLGQGLPSRGPARERPRPVAPDDDPEFLRKLDEERKREENGDGAAS